MERHMFYRKEGAPNTHRNPGEALAKLGEKFFLISGNPLS
jgi:hypothetical protein